MDVAEATERAGVHLKQGIAFEDSNGPVLLGMRIKWGGHEARL